MGEMFLFVLFFPTGVNSKLYVAPPLESARYVVVRIVLGGSGSGKKKNTRINLVFHTKIPPLKTQGKQAFPLHITDRTCWDVPDQLGCSKCSCRNVCGVLDVLTPEENSLACRPFQCPFFPGSFNRGRRSRSETPHLSGNLQLVALVLGERGEERIQAKKRKRGKVPPAPSTPTPSGSPNLWVLAR